MERGRLACIEPGAQAADLVERAGQFARALLQRGLVRGQGRCQPVGLAGQDAGDLRQAQAQRAQRHDVGAALQLGRAVRAPAGLVAVGDQQAALLIQPQGFGGDAEPLGGLAGLQVSSTGSHALHLFIRRTKAPL